MRKFLIISLILLVTDTGSSAQVTLQPVVPATGMIQKTQLWNVIIVNSSNEQYNCRLDLILKDRSSNLEVFTATTNVFVLDAGAKQLNINSLNPVQYNYLSPGFDAKQLGIIPVGNYTACYSLAGVGDKAINLADECIQFDVEALSPPMLINPADSSILDISPALFSWIPPSPDGMFNRLNYEIIITEINDGQKATEAIEQNIPFYSQGNLQSNFINYSAAYNSLEKDKWYAWQIVARDDKSYAAKSDTWVFKISKDSKIIKPVNDVSLLIQGESKGTYQVTSGKLNLKYFSPSKAYEGKVIFSDQAGVVIKTDIRKIQQGDNYLDFLLTSSFKPGITYKVTIIDNNNKSHFLTFSIQTKQD